MNKMDGEAIRKVRDNLGMSRDEFAALLCLSGYQSIMNIETGFRKPNKLAIRLIRYLESIPMKRAKAFIDEFIKHEPQ